MIFEAEAGRLNFRTGVLPVCPRPKKTLKIPKITVLALSSQSHRSYFEQ